MGRDGVGNAWKVNRTLEVGGSTPLGSTSKINILARVVKAIVSLASSKLTTCFSHGIIRKKLHNICLYKNEEHLFVHLFCSLYTPSACDGEITGGVKNGKPRSRLQPDWDFFLSSG